MPVSKTDPPTITVGELREHLKIYPDHYRLTFNGLEFYRLKTRGPELVQVEFSQMVYLDDGGNVVVDNLE